MWKEVRNYTDIQQGCHGSVAISSVSTVSGFHGSGFRFSGFFFDFLRFLMIFNVFRGFSHGKNDPQILIILSLFYVDFFFFRHIF